jgi:hypothetical protein
MRYRERKGKIEDGERTGRGGRLIVFVLDVFTVGQGVGGMGKAGRGATRMEGWYVFYDK